MTYLILLVLLILIINLYSDSKQLHRNSEQLHLETQELYTQIAELNTQIEQKNTEITGLNSEIETLQEMAGISNTLPLAPYVVGGARLNRQYKIYAVNIPINTMTIWTNFFMSLNDNACGNFGDIWEAFDKLCIEKKEPCAKAFTNEEIVSVKNDIHWDKILIVQDPLQRLVTAFLKWCVNGDWPNINCENYIHGQPKPTFEQFVSKLHENVKCRGQYPTNGHFQRQMEFAINLTFFTHIFVLDETYDSQVRPYLSSRGIPQSLIDCHWSGQPHTLPSAAFDFDSISDETMAQINEIYEKDFEFFDNAKSQQNICQS